MSYSVTVKKKAMKSLEQINEPYYSSIKTAMYALADNPRPHGYKKLKGIDGYPVRVGNYRIIYEIFDRILVVEVIAIGDRKEVYE